VGRLQGEGREVLSWTEERIDTLKKMWDSGLTATQIAEELGGVSSQCRDRQGAPPWPAGASVAREAQ
jgi:hypothetical protein